MASVPDAAPTHAYVAAFVREHLGGAGPTFNEHRTRRTHVQYVVDAARARGLDVVQVGLGYYFYSAGKAIGGIRKMVTTLVGEVAADIAASKVLTKHLLMHCGVPTPQGEGFKTYERDRAQALAGTFTTAVVKPASARAGEGVVCDVRTKEDFDRAWSVALRASEKGGRLLVEEQVSGLDIRAYVIGNHVAAAAVRLPAFVIGDGRRTITDLVQAKKDQRARNAYLAQMPIVVNVRVLATQGLAATSIPPDGEVVVLNDVANLHQGGENVDVTGMLDPQLGVLAVKAAAAIPGLHAAGVDIMAPKINAAHGAVVLEANVSANISVHHLPAYGEPVDVGLALADEMIVRSRASGAEGL